MSNITKFPINAWQRTTNKRGKRSVSCIVSERWLEFEKSSSKTLEGEAFLIYVMTKDKNDNPKKICTLAVTKEDLLKALGNVKLETKDIT